MCVRKLVAVAVMAAGSLIASPLWAADLSYRDEGPYSDPRYGEIYRVPAPPPPLYRGPVPPLPPIAPPQRYGWDERSQGCMPRHLVKEQLEQRGWSDFHDAQPMGNVVHMKARRPNGRLFDLTLERCSGQVVSVEPLDRRAAQVFPPQPDWRYEPPRYGRY